MATRSQKSKTPVTPAKETTNAASTKKPAPAKSSTPPLDASESPLDADTPPLDAYTDAPAVPLGTYDETPTGGRVPPQDLNAEKSLLGALLLSDASFALPTFTIGATARSTLPLFRFTTTIDPSTCSR